MGNDFTDRQLAARLCAACTTQLECLELELRQAGLYTVSIWGVLSEQDHRTLYLVWRNRRENNQEVATEQCFLVAAAT